MLQRTTNSAEQPSILPAGPTSTNRAAPWSNDSAPAEGRQGRLRLLAVAASVLAVILGAGLATSCESSGPDRAAVIDAVNASRASAGLAPLKENITLDVKADNWARHIRDVCNLSHSKLSDGAPPEWRKLGENVGRGGTIAVIHTAYMNSPGHRRNILDPAFNQIGAAAVWGTCGGARTVFTVQVFMKA